MTRTFIKQRYARGNWPFVEGHEPSLVSGPNFRRFVVPASHKQYEYRFVPELMGFIRSVRDFGGSQDLLREAVAELLLREGIVQALWVVSDRGTDSALWWHESVGQLVLELGSDPVWEGTENLLSGIPTPEMIRSYVLEDELELRSPTAPSD